MKLRIDLNAVSKVLIVLLISFIFFYLINSMARFGDGNPARQTASIQAIIDKALVQCYALEGSYPVSVEYVQKYGVVFDNAKYFYYYEWYGGNLKPTVIVIEK